MPRYGSSPKQQIQALLAQPECASPPSLAVLRLLASGTLAAYFFNMQLMQCLILAQVKILLEAGNTDATYTYSSVGMILCARGEVDAGYHFGQLALQLLQRYANPALKVRANPVISGFITHWKAHQRD